MQNPEAVFENYENQFGDMNDLYEEMTGKNVLEEIRPYVVEAITILNWVLAPQISLIEKILQQMYGGGYYLFVHCVDRAGNENEEQFFIKIDINRTADDTYPPIILQTRPRNMSEISYAVNEQEVSLYLNEPSMCRYSTSEDTYANMTKAFDCALSPYDMVPIAGGSYECTGEIPTDTSGAKIFIRCADNPVRVDKYYANFVPARKMELIDDIPSRYYNITGPGKVEVTDSIARRGVDLLVNTSAVRFVLYLNENKFCRFSHRDAEFGEMEGTFEACELSSRLDVGNYRCSALMDTSQYTAVTDASLELGNYTINIFVADKTEITNDESQSINVSLSSITINFTKAELHGNDSINFNLSMAGNSLIVNETAECRWTAKLNESYENMTDLSCIQKDNATFCQEVFPIIDNTTLKFSCRNQTEELKNVYTIKCRDFDIQAPNVNNKSYVYQLERTQPLSFSVYTDPDDVRSSPFKLIAKPSGDIVDDSITCSYNIEESPSYVPVIMETFDNITFEDTLLPDFGLYTFNLACSDKYGNFAENNTVIVPFG